MGVHLTRGASTPPSQRCQQGPPRRAPHLSFAPASPLSPADACQKPRVSALALRGVSTRLMGLLPPEDACGRGPACSLKCWHGGCQQTNEGLAPREPPFGTKSQTETVTHSRAPCGPGAEGSDFGPSPKQPLGSSQLPSRLLEPRSPPKVPSPSSTWQRARPFPSTRSGHRVSLLGCAGLWALTRMPGSRKVNTQSGM